MKIDTVVEKYIAVRDKKDELRKAYQAQASKLDDVLKRLEAALMQTLDANGQESAKTASGTAFIGKRVSATVADRDIFFRFVREQDAWDMLESRCSKVAVEQYTESNEEPPPGVTLRTERTVSVRRPTKR